MRIINKFFRLVLVLFMISIISFFLANISSIDSAETIGHHLYGNPSQEQIENIRIEKGLDKPAPIQYIKWLQHALVGDLGISYQTSNPVLSDIKDKLFATVKLVIVSLFFIAVITIPLSLVSAYKKDTLIDKSIQVITILGISVPSFWLGYVLLSIFAIKLPIFKVVEYGNFRSLILPAATLAAPVISSSVKILRTTLLENSEQEYVTYARARGLSYKRILYAHILKNSLPPMITLFFQNIGMMIAGSVIVENVFSWPGLGAYFMSAIVNRDTPAITGCMLILGMIFVISNYVSESINHFLNPHIFTIEEDN
ncbi:ABC transporter permease [Streptococcus anginosus]|uniref:ABC transporter, permease protein n=2 Tax=Bacillota TaxID=1239 RepID=D3MRL9_9FIRM|nr:MULTISPECIES: ABC transporter permease [Bacillota]MBS6063581.1 ABC transporter permease [Peptostreptococcaceae bacterium]EFD05225.1 ABC transporter, permease protein [Peptostreptococcus anaerobius 653-L]KAA9228824.1 ABC transporter permease [Streptococcus anginosus]MBK1468089.1 ABC transporter permease [Parvimonas parva]MDB8661184.1 ABC transporter permease [Streptococcus anginosus]